LKLKEEPNELKAVIISAVSFAAGDKVRGDVMSSLDVATTAGSNADITAALKTLPGPQQVGEQEGLFVRVEQVRKPSFLMAAWWPIHYTKGTDIATRGAFHLSFKGTVFSTGGYSALWAGNVFSCITGIYRSS
jgi:hypothetical protein